MSKSNFVQIRVNQTFDTISHKRERQQILKHTEKTKFKYIIIQPNSPHKIHRIERKTITLF